MSWSRRGFLALGGAAGVGLVGLGWPRSAQAGSSREAAIIARALSYERSLGVRVGASLTLAIVYAEGESRSLADAEAWGAAFASLAGVKVGDKPLELATVPWSAGAATAKLDEIDADVVLVCAGLDAELGAITDYTRAQQVLSVGSIQAYLDQRCTLGVFEIDGKLRILINLSAAERESVKFSSRLLKLAEVIR